MRAALASRDDVGVVLPLMVASARGEPEPAVLLAWRHALRRTRPALVVIACAEVLRSDAASVAARSSAVKVLAALRTPEAVAALAAAWSARHRLWPPGDACPSIALGSTQLERVAEPVAIELFDAMADGPSREAFTLGRWLLRCPMFPESEHPRLIGLVERLTRHDDPSVVESARRVAAAWKGLASER